MKKQQPVTFFYDMDLDWIAYIENARLWTTKSKLIAHVNPTLEVLEKNDRSFIGYFQRSGTNPDYFSLPRIVVCFVPVEPLCKMDPFEPMEHYWMSEYPPGYMRDMNRCFS